MNEDNDQDFSDPFTLHHSASNSRRVSRRVYSQQQQQQPPSSSSSSSSKMSQPRLMKYRDESSLLLDQVNRMNRFHHKQDRHHQYRLRSIYRDDEGDDHNGDNNDDDDAGLLLNQKHWTRNGTRMDTMGRTTNSMATTGTAVNATQLKSLERTRQKYGIPTAYLSFMPKDATTTTRNRTKITSTPETAFNNNNDWTRTMMMMTERSALTSPMNNPLLNLDQNDLGLIHAQLQNFLLFCCSSSSPTVDGRRSRSIQYYERVILEKELDIEMHRVGRSNYIEHWRQKLQRLHETQQGRNRFNNGSDDGGEVMSDKMIEREMKRLIERGKQRVRDMARAIQFLMSQHVVDQRHVHRAIVETAAATRKQQQQQQRQQQRQSQQVSRTRAATNNDRALQSHSDSIPWSYDLWRQNLFNEHVMSVFYDDGDDIEDGRAGQQRVKPSTTKQKKKKQKKRQKTSTSSLFDPFHSMGIEPPLNASSIDPSLFPYGSTVFNQSRIESREGWERSRREVLPPRQQQQQEYAMPGGYRSFGSMLQTRRQRSTWIPMIPQRVLNRNY